MPTVHGVPPSPFVPKVRCFLLEKGIEHDLKLVAPMGVSEEFRKISPLGKVPVYEEDGFILPDSSVICAYLERTHPEPRLYPEDPKAYARALWYEEYADTKGSDAAAPIFFQTVVMPKLMKQEGDQKEVRDALAQLPSCLDYLEAEVTGREYLVADAFSIADISVCTQLLQLVHANTPIDEKRYPELARYAGGILARSSFRRLIAEDDAMLSAT